MVVFTLFKTLARLLGSMFKNSIVIISTRRCLARIDVVSLLSSHLTSFAASPGLGLPCLLFKGKSTWSSSPYCPIPPDSTCGWRC